jgi:hypothetical protein
MKSLQGAGATVTGMSGAGRAPCSPQEGKQANSRFIPALNGRGTSAALGRPAPWAAVLSASLFPSDALRAFFLGRLASASLDGFALLALP